jgi:aspartate/methionine/tyrosine aminotransferase
MTDDAANGLRPFYAMEINGRAKMLELAGRSICHLEVGEPSAPPAPKVLEAVRASLDVPQKYTHFAGDPELRQAIAAYYVEQHGAPVSPDSIIVTMGSSAAFVLAFLAGFQPGARIAVTRPGYPAYLNTLTGMGFIPVELPVESYGSWRLTAAEIATLHKREPFDGLLLASPANPTGASLPRDELAKIILACRRLGVRFISDEIYHGLDYAGPSASALEFTRDAIVINSFSKYYCMTGWRVGWMVLPDDLLERAQMLQQNMFISAPSLAQVAARVALGERDYYEEQKATYARNRTRMTRGLSDMGLSVQAGDGAFYAYADVSLFANDSMTFAKELLEVAGVAATPGIDFDRTNGQRFVRFSFAGSEDTIEEALERISGFVRRG